MVRPKSEVKRQQLGARVDVNIIKKLKHIAIDKNVSFNVLIEEALEDFLKKYKQK
ncbi:MAG: ribbon-helix-helix domain-containing protein [Nitrospirota bacterium]